MSQPVSEEDIFRFAISTSSCGQLYAVPSLQESFSVVMESGETDKDGEDIPMGALGRPHLVEEEGDRVALVASTTHSGKKPAQRRARISSKPTLGVLDVSGVVMWP